jgi:hypothetical protein
MKPLVYCHDYRTHAEVKRLLDKKGIPTFSRDAGDGGRTPYLVFVCINSQLKDAVILLRDPDHSPSFTVDVEEFYERADTHGLPLISRKVTIIFVALILVISTIAVLEYYFPLA